MTAGNGDYVVTVSLHPPELGSVHAQLTLRGDQLQVALVPEQETGHDALAASLPALREHLGGHGVEVTVSLDDPRGQPGRNGSTPNPSGRVEQDTAPQDQTAPSLTESMPVSTDDRIHVVL